MTAAIAEIIRNGVYFDVKNWGDRMSKKSDNFFERIDALFDLLLERNIDYLTIAV